MKLLLDENLSLRLVPKLASLFAGVAHVRDVGLERTDNSIIWDWARTNGYSIVTADSDFLPLSQRLGWPPKVIRIDHCDFPSRIIEDLLRRSAVKISEFDKDIDSGLLVPRVSEPVPAD